MARVYEQEKLESPLCIEGLNFLGLWDVWALGNNGLVPPPAVPRICYMKLATHCCHYASFLPSVKGGQGQGALPEVAVKWKCINRCKSAEAAWHVVTCKHVRETILGIATNTPLLTRWATV